MSKDGPQLQSGRTQALDLDDIDRKRKKKSDDKWNEAPDWEDPWTDGPRQRKWADDERWTGDDSVPQDFGGGGGTMALDLNDVKKKDGALKDEGSWESDSGGEDAWDTGGGGGSGRGWSAPKRDEVLSGADAGGGWDDWNDSGGGESTMALNLDDLEAQKDLGGRRKNQAAKSYERDDTSAYGDGRSRRRDIYKAKEDAEFDRGLQSYSGGRRESYGEQQMQTTGDGWSSAPGERRPAQVPPLNPGESSGGPPSTLPANERTMALDLDSGAQSRGGGGQPETLQPDQATMALDGGQVDDYIQKQQGGAPAQAPTEGSLVIYPQNGQPVVYELTPGVTSIGRGLENNVVLSDPYASRKHFLIVHKDGQFEVRDSGTDNGTRINGQAVAHALLQPGDHIEVGSTSLKFVPGVAGPQEMQFAPPPQRPPHHLAPPPDGGPAQPGTGMHPGHGMPQPQEQKGGRKGLVFLLLFLVVVLVGGGGALAYFLLSGDDSSSKSSSSDTEESTGSMETGYQANTGANNDGKVKEAMADHEEGAAGEAGADGQKTAAAAETREADPVLVAGLVGSVAMATGKARPLEMTVYPAKMVTIKIETDPIDAEIYDAAGNLRGHSPYEVSEPAANDMAKWTVKKAGYDSENIEIDFSKGFEEKLDLDKKRRRRDRDRDKDKDERPTKPSIPTVD